MAWIARDKDETLNIYDTKPERDNDFNGWVLEVEADYCFECNKVNLPSDSDCRLIGRHIAWEDNPIEI